MEAERVYAASTATTNVSRGPSCDLIEALYAASLSGCPALNGLPALSFEQGKHRNSSKISFDGTIASSSTECGSVSNSGSSCRTAAEDDFDAAYHLFSRTAHMGILDPSYKLFTSPRGNGSLLYKIRNRVVVVAGDPMCEAGQTQALLDDFRLFRGGRRLKVVYVGASREFADYSRKGGCVTMQFGQERVLNPLTNPVLHDKSGKRIRGQCRQLLDPKRGNISLGIYCPSISGSDPVIEAQIQRAYDTWRKGREDNPGNSQAFITQYHLFSRPDLANFIHAKNSNGDIVGIATLRCLGLHAGFHLDPCIATDDAPRGVTDLLVVSAMQLLRSAGVSYLSMGFEPFEEVRNLEGQHGIMAKLTKDGYRTVMQSVHAAGKRAYYEKFHPDDSATAGLFIVLPRGSFHLREFAALIRTANISIGHSLSKTSRLAGGFSMLKPSQ